MNFGVFLFNKGDEFAVNKLLELQKKFVKAWSIHSSTKWSPENPAKGQCGVTALVVNDFVGGEILKTPVSEGWHYYNRINGQRVDLTDSQFEDTIFYEDIPSNREEAFSDTNRMQYDYLKKRINELITFN